MATMMAASWGTSGDVPLPADYDADGAVDLTVWRPSSGTWLIHQTTMGIATFVSWGTSGDRPQPGGFDGDLLSDEMVWRPSTGVWFLHPAVGPVATVAWGTAGDVPVVLSASIRPFVPGPE